MATVAQLKTAYKKKAAQVVALKKRLSSKCPSSSGVGGANGWPSLTAATSEQFARIGRGLSVSNPNQFAQIHMRLYHIVAYGTGGSTQLNFFNVGAQQHICNVNQGVLPDERPFWLTGLCVTWQDLDATGARSGNQLNAAAITSYARAEEVRTILQAGMVTLKIQDRLVLETQDLTHFPSDGGFHVSSSGISFASATASSAATFNNGEPLAGNRFKFPQPFAILPGKSIACTLNWQTALSVTTAGRIKVELVGESLAPLNA